MKRSFLAAIGVACLIFQGAHASVIFSDGFGYTSGDKLGAGSTTPPWTATATPTTYMAVGSANLTYSGLMDLGGNDLVLNSGSGTGVPAYASLTGAPYTSGSIYFSFLIECTSLPTSNSYLGALTPSTKLGPNGNTTDAIDINPKNSGSGWVLGVRTTGVSAAYESTVLSLSTVYFAVYKFTFNGSTPLAQLFLSPTPGGTEPGTDSAHVTGSGSAADVSGFGFKSQSGNAVGNYLIDNVLVGTTWADVTPTPEPSAFALAGLGVLSLFLVRRMSR